METNTSTTDIRSNFSLFAFIFLALAVFISSAGLRYASGSLNTLRDCGDICLEANIRDDYDAWNEIVRYARNLNRFFIHHRGFDATTLDNATEDDVAEDVASLTNILTFELSESIGRFMHLLHDEGHSPASLEAYEAQQLFSEEIAALAPLYIEMISSSWQLRLSERISNFSAIQNYLETTSEFVYVIHDRVLGETFTNIDAPNHDVFLRDEVYAVIDLADITNTFNGIPLNEGFARGGISGFIALPMYQAENSIVTRAVHLSNLKREASIESAERTVRAYVGLTAVMAITTAVVLLKALIPHFAGALKGFLLGLRIYSKIPLLIKILCAVYSAAFIAMFIGRPFERNLQLVHLFPLYLSVIVIMFSAVILVFALGGKYRFRDELEIRIARRIFSSFATIRRLSPVLLPAISILLMLVSAGSLILGLYCIYAISFIPFIGSLPLLLLCVAAFGVSLSACAALLIFTTYAESYYYIKIIAEGRPVVIPEQNGFFGKPLNVLSSLSHGLQSSVEEQIQAERTKTELITSVSHDLKTPLTSIINYVDLLKKSNISDENAREYVAVLENKSQRLKVLIEDLFEAAKLTSGSMELSLAPVDIVELLTQAIGELSDKFEERGIDIRYKPPSEKVTAMLDGQRMWRVFENLLNNIANYSPQGSRAYITVELHGEEVEIVMKNVSLYPLDIEPNELFERFKRGDTARSTEGSGLGLSIAKDIVELHGGKVEISIDGDLFKFIMRLRVST